MNEKAEYYTPEELAEKINVPVETIKEKAKRRKIPGTIVVFHRYRFNKAMIDLQLLKGKL